MSSSKTSSEDEFVRVLDGKRAAGLQLTQDDEYIPVDCPNCGELFSAHETAYRQWRDGEMKELLHPGCMAFFAEAPFARVRCSRCGAHSGYMPISICGRFHELPEGWTCSTCVSSRVKDNIRAMVNSPSEESDSTPAQENPRHNKPICLDDLLGTNVGNPTPLDTLRICESLGVTSKNAGDPKVHQQIVDEFRTGQLKSTVEEASRQIGIDLTDAQITSIAKCFARQGRVSKSLSAQERFAAEKMVCVALESNGLPAADAYAEARRMVSFFERGQTPLQRAGGAAGGCNRSSALGGELGG